MGFTAPEQLMGGRPSTSTDLYNLAAMLLNGVLGLGHIDALVVAHPKDAKDEGEYACPYMTVVFRS